MGILASDDFNRADEIPIAGNWSTPSGDVSLRLIGNAVTHNIPNYNDATGYYALAWPNDQYSQCTCTVGTTSGSGLGPVVRQATGANTRYRLVTSRATGNNFELAKQVGGTFTQIWARASAYTNGDPVRLEAQGTTLRAYNNGVQIGANSTDSSIASGNAGILYSSTDIDATADNWVGGDFAAAPSGSLFRRANLDGIGAGGKFFSNPLGT